MVSSGILTRAMDANELNPQSSRNAFETPQWTLLEAIPEFSVDYSPPPPVRRVWLPVLLFFATCASTLVAGIFFLDHLDEGWRPAIIDGVMYSGAVMTILLCHEMGHFVQAWRYGVHASLPYFIPMPLPPIGTLGAVIGMDPRRGDRKAIFDIGISGPLAGLVPTLIFLCLGLCWSGTAPIPQGAHLELGEPLVLKFLTHCLHAPIPDGSDLVLHPFAFAGWVGLLITSINLIPIGQLDGGHILYGMFRKKAHVASIVVLATAISVSIALTMTHWWLMLVLVTFLGARHPPTADDSVALGTWRYVLGVLTLAFLFFGFTPVPIMPIGFGH
jgi:membrane-associated protease RseP (regulator of RpoE activity)